MLHVLICDDDPILCQSLHQMLIEVASKEILDVQKFTTGTQLLHFLEDPSKAPDIIFMDIKLVDSSGIDIAKSVIDHNPATQIIFISAYDNYYTDVYAVDHIYFLRKPIDHNRLLAAFTHAKEKIAKERNNFFTVIKKQGIWKIPLSSIYFFEKRGRLLLIHDANTVIHEFYDKLPKDLPHIQERFVRCHNSYLVNLSKISSLSGNVLKLENGITINISRSRHEETKSAFAAYLERSLPCIF